MKKSLGKPASCETSYDFEQLLKKVYFTTLSNEQRFDTESYGTEDGPIVNESTIRYSMMPSRPQRQRMKVHQRIAEFDDNLLFSVGGMSR